MLLALPPEHAQMLEEAHDQGIIDLDHVCYGGYTRDQNGVFVARINPSHAVARESPILHLRHGMREIVQKAEPFYLGT